MSILGWSDVLDTRLRIITASHGFDHVSTSVVAQWQRLDDHGQWTIDSSQVLVPPGMQALEVPTLEHRGVAIRVELSGVHSYQHTLEIRCSIDLLADGSVRRHDNCSRSPQD